MPLPTGFILDTSTKPTTLPSGFKLDTDIEKEDTITALGLVKRFGKQLYNIIPRTIDETLKFAAEIGEGWPVVRGEELEKKLREKYAPRAERLIAQGKGPPGPQYIPVSPATTVPEKGVDVAANVIGFVAQLKALKKGLPKGTPEGVVWEVQNLMTGGTPGAGAAMYTAFGVPGKVIPGKGVLAKGGRLTAESAMLGGMSAAEQKLTTGEIDWVEVGISAGIPPALRTVGLVKAGIRLRSKKVNKALTQINPELIERLPSQKEIIKQGGKLQEYLIDRKAADLYDKYIEGGNLELQKRVSNLIQGQNLPTLDSLYARVNEGDTVATEMIQAGLYSSSPESFLEGFRVEAARQLKIPYTTKGIKSKFEYYDRLAGRPQPRGPGGKFGKRVAEYRVGEVTTEERPFGVSPEGVVKPTKVAPAKELDIQPGDNVYRGKESGKVYIERAGAKKEQQTTRLETTPDDGTKLVAKDTGEELVQATDLMPSGIAKLTTAETVNPKVIEWANTAKKLNKTEVKEAVHKLRKQQAVRGMEQYKRLRAQGVPRLTALIQSRRGYVGMANKPTIEPLNLSDAEWDAYGAKIEEVYEPVKQQFQRTGAAQALLKMRQGIIPTRYDFGLLEPVLGFDTTAKLYEKLSPYMGYTWWDLPRLTRDGMKTLMFGIDPQVIRASAVTGVRHPKIFSSSVKANVATYKSKEVANKLRVELESHPLWKKAKEKYKINFLGMTPWASGEAGTALQQYGDFADYMFSRKNRIAKLIGRIYKASERGAAVGINKGLLDHVTLAEKEFEAYRLHNPEITDAQMDVIMRARGRDINAFFKRVIAKNPKAKKIQEAANWIQFSTAYTVSRPIATGRGITRLFTGTGIKDKTYAMQMVLSNIAAIQACDTIIAYVANLYRLQNPDKEPPIDSSTNPTDSMWGKVRQGNDVYDLTFGEASTYRLMARLGVSAYLSGQKLITGKEQTTFMGRKAQPAGEEIRRYLQSRETVLLGALKVLATGKDWLGKKLTWKEAAWEVAPAPQLIKGFVEAGLADGVWENIASGDITTTGKTLAQNLPVLAFETAGGGVLTYPVKAAETRMEFRNIISRNEYNKEWDELSKMEQFRLKSKHRKELKELDEKVKSERAEEPYDYSRIIEEEEKSGKKIRGLLSKENRNKISGISTGVSRSPKEFYLNDKRYQRYQELVAQYLNDRLSKYTPREVQNESVRRRILESFVSISKQRAYYQMLKEEK